MIVISINIFGMMVSCEVQARNKMAARGVPLRVGHLVKRAYSVSRGSEDFKHCLELVK